MHVQILTAALVVAVLSGAATASEGMIRAAPGALVHQGPGSTAQGEPVADGAGIQVTGCLAGWDWCRVVVDGLPGWMDGRHLLFDSGGRTVTVTEAGAGLGIPVIAPGAAPPSGPAVDVAPPGG